MRSLLALGVLLSILATAGTGVAVLTVVEQVGGSASAAADATLAAAEQVAGSPPDQELGPVAYIVDNQVYVITYAAGIAYDRTELVRATAAQLAADGQFALDTELQAALTAMDLERALVHCMGDPDPAGAALCAYVVAVVWSNGVVQA